MLPGPGRRLLALCCALLVVTGSWLVPGTAAAAEAGKLVLVLDSSGSMAERVGGTTKISLAKSALTSVVRKLPEEAQVGLRVYGAEVFERSDEGACTDSQLVVPLPAVVGIAVGALALGAGAVAAGRVLRRRRRPGR